MSKPCKNHKQWLSIHNAMVCAVDGVCLRSKLWSKLGWLTGAQVGAGVWLSVEIPPCSSPLQLVDGCVSNKAGNTNIQIHWLPTLCHRVSILLPLH